ncbi:MAG: sigma-70 family RNA polymerase sigma factor [Prevotella sp.]|nr:sigma-70 family RNA polymerase sigma factor [Prevotella sp.]
MATTGKKELERQIAEYQPQLKSFIRKRVGRKEDAEDILQDVLYQLIIRTVNTAMNPIENLSAWLYRVARNTIINLGVKKREEELFAYRDSNGEEMNDISDFLFDDEYTVPTPETEYLRSLVWVELDNALSELPPEQRSIFELTELNGIPVKEIAQATGTPVATLLSRKHYAVVHLRKRLENLYAEPVFAP